MRIDRIWSMPSKRTFQILPIRILLIEEETDGFLDPFPYPFKQDALIYLSRFNDNTVDGVLFDPPYSLRQLKECYHNIGRAITADESKFIYSRWKDEIARVIKPGGKCISFAWNSGGLGEQRGFEITRILLVPHGGNHNDTIVTVEIKTQSTLI